MKTNNKFVTNEILNNLKEEITKQYKIGDKLVISLVQKYGSLDALVFAKANKTFRITNEILKANKKKVSSNHPDFYLKSEGY